MEATQLPKYTPLVLKRHKYKRLYQLVGSFSDVSIKKKMVYLDFDYQLSYSEARLIRLMMRRGFCIQYRIPCEVVS